MSPHLSILCVLLLLVARTGYTSADCTYGYLGPTDSLMCTCNAGYVGGNFYAPWVAPGNLMYNANDCNNFISLILWKPAFATVSTRNSAGVPAYATLPSYNPYGGPTGKGHITFDKASNNAMQSSSQIDKFSYLRSGFTLIMIVQFTGTVQASAGLYHITDVIGSGGLQGYLVRSLSSNSMQFRIHNDGVSIGFVTSAAAIVQNTGWVTVVATFQASTRTVGISVNGGAPVTQVASSNWDNKYTCNHYLGKSPTAGNEFTGNMAGVFVVDEYISPAGTTAIANAMLDGVDLTDTTCPSGNDCTACEAGKYKSITGTAKCTDCITSTYSNTLAATVSTTCRVCPVNSISPSGSTALAACMCNVGFSGPNGGNCSACVAGTYKNATGSVACTHCEAATYSNTLAATVSTTCLACPANSTSPSFSTALTACTCKAGLYGPNGSTCTACPVNSGESCSGCNASISCTCNRGYIGPNGGVCSACATGTYKNTTGTVSCTACADGTYSTTAGATDAGTCVACPTNSGASCIGCSESNMCTCNAGFTGGNFISPYSTTACSRFVALMIQKPSFASVSTRANASVGVLPTYHATGGPNGNGHVSFDRALLQYLDAGPRTFDLKTNGGFTIVSIIRFTGTLALNERIIEMWSGSSLELLVYRWQTTATLTMYICESGCVKNMQITPSTTFVQDSWIIVKISYSSSTYLLDFTVNGAGLYSYNIGPWNDKIVSGIYIGKSKITASRELKADVAGVFVVDEYLSTDARTAIADAMTSGLDLTDTTCPSGNACAACGGGQYKNTNGTAVCTPCAAGKYSATTATTCLTCHTNSIWSAGSTSCVCDLGYQPGA